MIIDTHCHLQLIDRAHRRDCLQRSVDAGVDRWVVPAYQPEDWPLLDILESADGVQVAKGIHPWVADLYSPTLLDQLSLKLSNCCAVGETGLDGNDARPSQTVQLASLNHHLWLASEHQLPIILHAYKAHNALVREIKKHPSVKGVVHAFSGSYNQAMQYVDAGYLLGIGGVITYDRAEKTRKAISKVPLEALVLETDSPSMPIAGRQGEPNEPRYCKDIAITLANLKDVPLDTVIKTTTKNAVQLFGL